MRDSKREAHRFKRESAASQDYSLLGTEVPGYKERGKQEESQSQEEACSGVCGRSPSFVGPGWNECARAQVWPRHQAAVLFSELAVKGGRSA